MSLAGSEAAEARRRAAATLGDYNLKLGTSAWRLGAGLSAEWNDNIRLTDDNSLSDTILRPELDCRMVLRVTEQNSFHLGLAAGYSFYAHHSEYDRLYVRPGSELAFDLYAGDVWINLHDRISMLQDSYEDPTVVGAADYSRLENAVGATAMWDLNEALVRVGFDHVNYVSLGGESSNEPDGASEVAFIEAGLRPAATVLYGVQAGAAWIGYEPDEARGFEQALQWNAGAFADAKLTEYISVQANGGYGVFSPEPAESAPAAGDHTGAYAQVMLVHRVNQQVSQRIKAGRTLSFTFYGGTIDLWEAEWSATWSVVRGLGIDTAFEFEHGEYVAPGTEKFDRFGPGVRLTWRLGEKLTALLRCQFYVRDSNLEGRDYRLSVVSAGVQHAF